MKKLFLIIYMATMIMVTACNDVSKESYIKDSTIDSAMALPDSTLPDSLTTIN